MQRPQGVATLYDAFPKPACSPASSPFKAGSSPAVGDKAMSDSEFVPPRTRCRPDTPFDADRDEAIAAVRSIPYHLSV